VPDYIVERKLGYLQAWAVGGLAFLLAFAVSFVVYASWASSASAKDRTSARMVFCSELEKVRTFARDSGIKTLKDAKTPGTATYLFLKRYPDLASAVRTNAQHTVDAFSPPLQCKLYAEGKIATPAA
jgi:hypothetical protein